METLQRVSKSQNVRKQTEPKVPIMISKQLSKVKNKNKIKNDPLKSKKLK